MQVATETTETINDCIYGFSCSAGGEGTNNDGLLGQIADARKNRLDENVLVGLSELITGCLQDDDIMEYVYNCPAPTA